MRKKNKVTKGHYHEAADRIFITVDQIENNILTHPTAKAEKEARKLINKAQDLLMQAYQIMGAKM